MRALLVVIAVLLTVIAGGVVWIAVDASRDDPAPRSAAPAPVEVRIEPTPTRDTNGFDIGDYDGD